MEIDGVVRTSSLNYFNGTPNAVWTVGGLGFSTFASLGSIHIPKVIIFEGDSLSDVNFSPSLINASENIVLTNWSTLEDNVYNIADGGKRAEESLSGFTTQILPLFDVSKDNLVIYWIGTNDIYNPPYYRSGEVTYNYIKDFWELCKNNGFKVIANTLISRGTWDSSQDIERRGCNDLIRLNWSTYCDALVDLDSDSRLGGQDANLNTTYFYGDHTHLNQNGQNVVWELLLIELNKMY